MVNWNSRKLSDTLLLANGLVLVVLLNLLASKFFFRLDLTEEGRYSIKEPTKKLLRDLDDKVYIEVFLNGELNADFRRFRKSIEEVLEEFRIHSNNNVQFVFTDPHTAQSQQARNEFMADLAAKGVQPTRIVDTENGQRTEKIIFPGALVSYGGFETGVTLLKGNKARSPLEEINQSIEGVEYEIANAIKKLVNTDRKRIGLVTGHGELDSLDIAAFNNTLLEQYDVFKVSLQQSSSLHRYDALIIAKPVTAFSDLDKYELDQYIMGGGRVMFLLDKVRANIDSISNRDYMAVPYELNLDDLLFRYGVRINYDLIQDRTAALYPVVTGESGGGARMQMMEWPFFPLINHYAEHAVTRNMDAVLTRFVNSMDTVRAAGVTKTPLLVTSQYARTVGVPVNVNVEKVLQDVTPDDFTRSNIPVAYLLEGTFTSLFRNRFLPEGAQPSSFKEMSVPAKVLVIADGDIARNDINPRTGQPQPLGFDMRSNYTFANQDLLMNAIAYLVDEEGLIQARNKLVKIRPLDRERVAEERTTWQLVNILAPLFVLLVFGVARAMIRKRKFASFR